ncbi:MAG: hypothetical protein ACKV0T_18700 [Planctomycetales bacterium]
MKRSWRRLTFQLVSLFDLLIIIVFAQYFDLQGRTNEQLAEAAQQREPGAAELQQEIDRLLQEQESLRTDATQKQSQLRDDLQRAHADLQRLGDLVAELFDVPAEPLESLLRARSGPEVERIRKSLKELASNRTSAAVRQILTLDELEKRCDLWQIHIRDDGVVVFTFEEHTGRFRADTPARFANELFKQYKSLPQPKSLVLMLLSWGDAELRLRTAAIEGMETAAERLRSDTDRRSRFESAILGFIPSRD